MVLLDWLVKISEMFLQPDDDAVFLIAQRPLIRRCRNFRDGVGHRDAAARFLKHFQIVVIIPKSDNLT